MKILILCTGNSCRSQIAEGFMRSFDRRLTVRSAGTRPADQVNPIAVEVMREKGIDLTTHYPKDVSEFTQEQWDYVITVCGNAERNCPVFAGEVVHRLHIGFDDPAEAVGTEQEIRAEFCRIRDEIEARFLKLYNEIKKDI